MLESMTNAVNLVGSVATVNSVAEPAIASATVKVDKGTEFFAKLMKLGVNLDELGCILTETESSLIIAGAGAGKTTALILKILYDLDTGYCYKTVEIPSANGDNFVKVPANILVTTFLKSGAEDLKKSFFDWSERLGIRGIDTSKIVFRTLHSEVYQALKSMGVDINITTDNTSVIRSVMKKFGIRSVVSRSQSITVEEIRDIECIISYARNRLDDRKYQHPLMQDYNLDKLLLECVLKETKLSRRLSQVMDYEDLQEILLDTIKKNPAVKANIQSRYDFIYCDEFQDTSQLQYALLQYYFDAAKRVICIGDDDQCIYSWRGSDINIITKYFREDYAPKIHKLSTNYRCKSSILSAVIPSIVCNENRFDKSLRSAVEGGDLKVLVNYPVSDLITRVRNDALMGKTVSILSRTNNDLLVPAIVLEMSGGVDYCVSKSLGMRSRLPRSVFGVIELLTKRYSDKFEEYFRGMLPYKTKMEAQLLCDILKNNKDLSLFNINSEDLSDSVPYLYNSFLREFRQLKEKDTTGRSAYDYALLAVRDTFIGSSAYAKRARDLINYVFELVHSDLCDKLSLFELDTLFNITLPDHLDTRVSRTQARVKLSTIHEAKGKEWDSVYIWNDIRGVFPAMVGNRKLTQEEFEEERRLHYIAWTRAKSSLCVYSTQGVYSPYLEECNCDKDIAVYKVKRGMQVGKSQSQCHSQRFDLDSLVASSDIVLSQSNDSSVQSKEVRFLDIDDIVE